MLKICVAYTWQARAGSTRPTTPPACTGSSGWWHYLGTPAAGRITTAMAAGQSRAEDGQGAVRHAICAAGVPTGEMACWVDLGTFVLVGSNIQKNWATDFGGMVGRGRGNEAGEEEDVLGTIAGGRGGSGSIASARGGGQWQSPEPPPPPSPASRASLARMVRMSLSLSPSSSVGVSKPIIISLNLLVLVLP
jgi:hypothetical protein